MRSKSSLEATKLPSRLESNSHSQRQKDWFGCACSEPTRLLERIAVFEPDYVLVPIIMRERLAESNIEGIVETDAGAHSDLQIHDVHATHFVCGPVDSSSGLSFKSAV